tara:strand:+ start:123 stop:932 length:810 start_codon:yes stop_codon:yes gene_type:complete
MPTITIFPRRLGRILNPKQNQIKSKKVESILVDKEIVSEFTEASENIEESNKVDVVGVQTIQSNDTNMSIVFPKDVLLNLFLNTPTNYMGDLYLSSISKLLPLEFNKLQQDIKPIIDEIGSVDKNGFIRNKIFQIILSRYNFLSQNALNRDRLLNFISSKLIKFTPKLTLIVTDSTETEICGQVDFTTRFSQNQNVFFDNTNLLALGNDALDASAPGLSTGEYYKVFFLFERFFPLTLSFSSGVSPGQFGNLYIHVVSNAVPGAPQLKI